LTSVPRGFLASMPTNFVGLSPTRSHVKHVISSLHWGQHQWQWSGVQLELRKSIEVCNIPEEIRLGRWMEFCYSDNQYAWWRERHQESRGRVSSKTWNIKKSHEPREIYVHLLKHNIWCWEVRSDTESSNGFYVM
jgi:hypothetical protein